MSLHQAFYVSFLRLTQIFNNIHLHPIDETKNLKNKEHITTNRPLSIQFSKMEAGKMKADGEFLFTMVTF